MIPRSAVRQRGSSREGIRARLVRGSTMKGSIAAVLAAGACGVGFLAGWLVFHSDVRCKIELPLTQPLQRAEAAAVSDRAPDLEKPDSRLVIQSAPVETPATAPIAQPVQSPVTPTPADPPDPRNLPESTLAEMSVKRNALQAIVNDLTRPIIKHRFEEGLLDHMSDDPNWRPGNSDWDRSVISAFRSGAKGCDRTNVPRDQYPDVYVYYDETLRLDDLIHEGRPTTGK